jgi:hypothetical protein
VKSFAKEGLVVAHCWVCPLGVVAARRRKAAMVLDLACLVEVGGESPLRKRS